MQTLTVLMALILLALVILVVFGVVQADHAQEQIDHHREYWH